MLGRPWWFAGRLGWTARLRSEEPGLPPGPLGGPSDPDFWEGKKVEKTLIS
jgi:hypothetical protein